MLRVSSSLGRQLTRTAHRKIYQTTVRSAQELGNKKEHKIPDSPNTISDKSRTVEDKEQGRTPDNPFLVASPTNKCIVGCTCEPESHLINWFYVTEGEPQTCSCGYYFKLDKVDASKTWVPEYSQIMYVDERRVDPRLQKHGGVLQGLFSRRKRTVKPPPSMSNSANKPKAES